MKARISYWLLAEGYLWILEGHPQFPAMWPCPRSFTTWQFNSSSPRGESPFVSSKSGRCVCLCVVCVWERDVCILWQSSDWCPNTFAIFLVRSKSQVPSTLKSRGLSKGMNTIVRGKGVTLRSVHYNPVEMKYLENDWLYLDINEFYYFSGVWLS